MKYRSKITAILLPMLVLVTMMGCNEDQLEIVNPNAVAEADFFKTEADFKKTVNGMFHSITAVLFWGRVVHIGPFLRSDAYNIVPNADNTVMSTFQASPGSRWVSDMYPQMYQCIFRANTILEKINTENVPDEGSRNQFTGQAHFARAFANWYLVNLFRNVPKIDKTPKSKDDFFPAQESPEELLKFIIEDLTKAFEQLPEEWPVTEKGRPTKGAALAFRGKTKLYIQDYVGAAEDLRKVTTDFNYGLLSAANYSDNFTPFNENNMESVYEIQFQGQDNFIWASGADDPGTGGQGHYLIDYLPPTASPDNGHFINPHILDVFEKNNDTLRRNQTLVFDYPEAKGYGGIDFEDDFAKDIEQANEIGIPAIFTKKYAGFEQGKRGDIPNLGNTIGNNWRVIRYADVLLMLAEALNENGDPGSAIPLINEIRERALITPLSMGLDQAAVREAIIDERIMELTGEGHRFFDLVRWDLAEEILGDGATIADGRHPKSLAGGAFTKDRDEYLWIPLSELEANPNMRQNCGYAGTGVDCK